MTKYFNDKQGESTKVSEIKPEKRIGESPSERDSGSLPALIIDDENGVGGQRINNITIFGDDNDNSQDKQDLFIKYFRNNRSGRTIKNIFDFIYSEKLTPIIRFNSLPIISKNDITDIEHKFGNYSYGQSNTEYLVVDDNENFIPLKDYKKINPVEFIENNSNIGYPILTRLNEDNYLDPSRIDGSIDVTGLKTSFINASISDINSIGIKGDYQLGEDIVRGRGSSIIQDIIDKRDHDQEKTHFLDSNDNILTSRIKVPGYITEKITKTVPFDESDDILKKNESSYQFLDDKSILENCLKSFSDIGNNFKSSTSGLIFGESNVLGTDSIAFGGLKK